jgi:hypothetical protein
MKQIGLLILSLVIFCTHALSQMLICNIDTAFYMNFGAGNSRDPDLSFLSGYNNSSRDGCPNDGDYAFVSASYDCFGGNWHNVAQDHTPGDVNGKMMLVNAAYMPGTFYATKVSGLKGNTTYELSAWVVNVCRRTVGCRTVYPDIDFLLVNHQGRLLTSYNTGIMPMEPAPVWKKYSVRFTTPTVVGDFTLQLRNRSDGGCGDDFAIDDILITACQPVPPPQTQQLTAPIVAKPIEKPVQKPKPVAVEERKKEVPPTIVTPKTTMPKDLPASKEIKLLPPAPRALVSRSNPLIKQIFTDSTDLKVELYDNGIVDGDTVSIYHNNELIVSQAALSAKPIRLTIRVDPQHPHHELVMVANNLGSIPPNTSLMIVTTANDKRYQVFISSDDKTNAKIVIDLKE